MGEPRRLDDLVLALSERGDVTAMARVLTTTLAAVLPADLVEVGYRRSAADRLRGRPGVPTAVTVRAGDRELTIGTGADGRPRPAVAHRVQGVVISRRDVTLQQWIAELTGELDRLAADDTATRAALERLLLD